MTAVLTESQKDALTELVNIGMGVAANSLNRMMDSHIELHMPELHIASAKELDALTKQVSSSGLTSVKLDFTGPISGSAALIMPQHDASKMVSELTGEPPNTPELNSMMVGTLNEVGNIVINGVLGTLSSSLNMEFDFGLPIYQCGEMGDLLTPINVVNAEAVIIVKALFKVQQYEIEGDILLIFISPSYDNLLSRLDALYEQ